MGFHSFIISSSFERRLSRREIHYAKNTLMACGGLLASRLLIELAADHCHAEAAALVTLVTELSGSQRVSAGLSGSQLVSTGPSMSQRLSVGACRSYWVPVSGTQ